MEERPASIPRDACIPRLDDLLYCHSPVYQLSQYYKFGELDDCRQKWSDLLECMRNKATKKSAEVEELSTRTALWEMRTKKEAQSFWRKEFGDGNVGESHREKSNIV